MQQILDCPTVHGALASILGDDYLLHPHRYMHPSEPVGVDGSGLASPGQNNAVMGEGSKSSPGKGREITPRYERAANGRLVAQLNHRNERRWQESATVYEDAAYALGAIGAPAVSALTRLVADDDAWVGMNAAFALGECGVVARGSVPALAKLLHDPSHRVVRCAIDAITAVGAGFEDVFDEIATLLRERRATWLEPIRREWTGNDQVHFNAMCALVNSTSTAMRSKVCSAKP